MVLNPHNRQQHHHKAVAPLCRLPPAGLSHSPCLVQTGSLVPFPKVSDTVVEPYSATLSSRHRAMIQRGIQEVSAAGCRAWL